MKKKRMILISFLLPFYLRVYSPDNGRDIKNLLEYFIQCDDKFYSTLISDYYHSYYEHNHSNAIQTNITSEMIHLFALINYSIQEFSKTIAFNDLNLLCYRKLNLNDQDQQYFLRKFEIPYHFIDNITQTLFWINWQKIVNNYYTSDTVIVKNNKWLSNHNEVSDIKRSSNIATTFLLIEKNYPTRI